MTKFVCVRFKKVNGVVTDMRIFKQGYQKDVYSCAQQILDERRVDVETFDKVKGDASHFECEYNNDDDLIVEVFLVRKADEYLSTIMEEIKDRLKNN